MFLENHNVKAAIAPKDLIVASTGARVSLKEADVVTVIVNLGTSLTGGVVNITLNQHTLESAGTTIALPVANPYFKKVGAATVFTKVEPASAASNYVLSTDFDTESGIVVFEVEVDKLAEGYAFFSVSLASSVVAKIGSVEYILGKPSFKPAYLEVI